MGTGMGLTLIIAGAPEPGEQSQAVCRPGRPCLLKTRPQGSEARLRCCSTDNHQMEPLPACGHPGAFCLAWEASLLGKGPTFWPQPLLPALRDKSHFSAQNHLREN